MSETLAARVHGGPDASGTARYDFSTNANACGPCPVALDAVRAADVTRYPDPSHTAVRTALARLHGVAPERIVVAASASEFIFRITGWAARRGADAVSAPRHAFGDYAAAARGWGLRVSEGPAPLVWACEPSSPFGVADARLQQLPPAGATVVVDQAYEPLRLAGAPQCPAWLADRAWRLWTPNKALGLTGVRGAYAIAPLDATAQVAGMEALAPSWPLGAAGEALLLAWPQPVVQAWVAHSLDRLREWKGRQLGICLAMGWQCERSDTPFMVARMGDADTAAALAHLRSHGIRLRDCASFGLPGRVRLSVQPPASQDALRRAWEAFA